MSRFTLTLDAVEDGQRLGIDRSALQSIANASAKFTHPIANRRTGEFLFEMDDDQVIRVFREDEIETRYCKIVCPDCEGQGCNACMYNGFIYRNLTFIAGELYDDVTLMEEPNDDQATDGAVH